MKTNEAPCGKSGSACRYVVEEDHDAEGLLTAWDLHCADCGSYRDWSKELCEVEDSGQSIRQ